MKRRFSILGVFCFILVIILTSCASNPISGKKTMAFVNNSEIFPASFQAYEEFLKQNTVVTGTPEAAMLERVGNRLRQAAEKWLAAEGQSHYLDDYAWEYKLIQSNEINAWAMPGGKIAFYTGILPITKDEDGIAVVMGHEIAHVLLNHGQQRMSAGVIQELGAVGLSMGLGVLGLSPQTQQVAMLAYGVGSEVGGTLPFSRKHEYEADEYGLTLMAIAGYNVETAVAFWERMSSLGGSSTPQFLSTHPSDDARIKNLQKLIPQAKEKAAQIK